MEDIYGWLATYTKGNIDIQYKKVSDILMEDLGYCDILYDEYDPSEVVNEQEDYFEKDNTDIMNSAYRRLDDEESLTICNFLTYGKEIFSQGDRMVFQLDERDARVHERIMAFVANIKVMG